MRSDAMIIYHGVDSFKGAGSVVFSVSEDADLLDADNWTVSEPIHHGGKWRQWIE